jgi:competence protein ComEA
LLLALDEDNQLNYENQAAKVININFASRKELEDLPGIGSELASRIVRYRETHGAFESIEGLKKVSGIGEKKYNDIKEMISV